MYEDTRIIDLYISGYEDRDLAREVAQLLPHPHRLHQPCFGFRV